MAFPFKFTFFSSLLFMLILSSCGDEVLDEFITDEPGTVTAKIDGVNFKSAGFSPISVSFNDGSLPNSYDLQIDAERELNGFEETISFSLFGLDFASLKAGDVFLGGADIITGGKRFDGDYYKKSRIEGDDTDIISDSEQMPPSTAMITKIDFDNRLISGTFSFKSIDIFDSSNSFQITDGVFTEIKY